MSAVKQTFRPCHTKQATVQLSMAKHDNKISHCCCDISQVEHPISHPKCLTKKNNRTDELYSVKYSKMLSFSLVAEALTGLIYHRPSGENFSSTCCIVRMRTVFHLRSDSEVGRTSKNCEVLISFELDCTPDLGYS